MRSASARRQSTPPARTLRIKRENQILLPTQIALKQPQTPLGSLGIDPTDADGSSERSRQPLGLELPPAEISNWLSRTSRAASGGRCKSSLFHFHLGSLTMHVTRSAGEGEIHIASALSLSPAAYFLPSCSLPPSLLQWNRGSVCRPLAGDLLGDCRLALHCNASDRQAVSSMFRLPDF